MVFNIWPQIMPFQNIVLLVIYHQHEHAYQMDNMAACFNVSACSVHNPIFAWLFMKYLSFKKTAVQNL